MNDYLESLYTLIQTIQEIAEPSQAIYLVMEQENLLDHLEASVSLRKNTSSEQKRKAIDLHCRRER